MALKKVDEGTRTVSIDKVIGKTKNGIEVNGVAYWYSKSLDNLLFLMLVMLCN